ncbi:hypothetical protein ILUMI_01328 [Ignelater luminosus]|uniref:Peptidase S1 domain-containing protein n=1 Tax=Ignelater luminosus TaxID=2038154 RepID=A0A8K0GKD5_IGNLU|nr:hypothetical protein ILUMI_01328 [Ignelater luminosus]
MDAKIVGGTNATIEDHPYQLSLELFGRHFCGASLIKPDVAVTAAHCTRGSRLLYTLGFLSVRAGTPIRGRGGWLVGVTSICIHPKYNGQDYDVSVLHLDVPFELNDRVRTIPILPKNVVIPLGTIATVSGFGTLRFRGPSSKFLLAVKVPKVSQEACERAYPLRIKPRMICFGFDQGGKDSCQGDSGGPLVVNGLLAGIVSFGKGCGLPSYPGVYTNVADPEVNDHINSCIAKVKDRPFGIF